MPPPRAAPASAAPLSAAALERRLEMVRRYVGKPIPAEDPAPSDIGGDLYVGNKHHAADVVMLHRLGITAVLNCASSGIRDLPLGAYRSCGIEYAFTNVAADAADYPILLRDGAITEHLEVALGLYDRVRAAGGKALFFCVAGQNRSATLGVAARLARGEALGAVLAVAARSRPFILENLGFQRQLVELEARYAASAPAAAAPAKRARGVARAHSSDVELAEEEGFTVELLVPGRCTYNVGVPRVCAIDAMRRRLVAFVDGELGREAPARRVGAAWLVFGMFDAEGTIILDEAAVEPQVQATRLNCTFGLHLHSDPTSEGPLVEWSPMSRFELVLFSVVSPSEPHVHHPFLFRHEERAGAPGTLLSHSIISPHLRAWDFVTGEPFQSVAPIVFSFSSNPREKRDFMNISTSADGARQQFDAPGEGGILGMGNNAIVHHVKLEAVRKKGGGPRRIRRQDTFTALHQLPPLAAGWHPSKDELQVAAAEEAWDAAVKRPFSLAKMLASIGSKAEAGVAKRLRMASALNKQGRLLYFYGLGIALASNNCQHEEYRFEATILSQYQEDFSSYTLKRFMDDYTQVTSGLAGCDDEEAARVRTLQAHFSVMEVKVLLVSLLNAFRDLTLSGLQAFDFNHLNNVLVSRDYKKARLIDIDGQSRGSIQFCADDPYLRGGALHRPALDIDLSTMMPMLVQQLLLGKGKGTSFVHEQVHAVRVAAATSEEEAKGILKGLLADSFFKEEQVSPALRAQGERHLQKMVEWFFAVLLKKEPWELWTNDIYDAMRCIDHLPIA